MSRSEFASLGDSCAPALLTFFVRRTGDPHTARDLWAETFAQAFAARPGFRGTTSQQAASWLYGIAYRQLAQYHRRGAIEQRALRRLAAEPPPLSDADLERLRDLAGIAELGSAIDSAMRGLPDPLRHAVAFARHRRTALRRSRRALSITPQAALVRARLPSAVHAARRPPQRPEHTMKQSPPDLDVVAAFRRQLAQLPEPPRRAHRAPAAAAAGAVAAVSLVAVFAGADASSDAPAMPRRWSFASSTRAPIRSR